jgi:ABC-type glycerol-3-phosphate transport system permease component
MAAQRINRSELRKSRSEFRARHPRKPRATIALHLALLVFAMFTIAPFAWVVCAAFKSPADQITSNFLPARLENLTLDNFRQLFAREQFGRWMLNSVFLACAYTVAVVTLSSLGGFALAKYRFAGQRVLMAVMLATMLVPGQVLLLPNYEVMYRLGWLDTFAAILVPSAVSVFGMFLFRQAMQAVPDELLQAGRVDGCSELRLWWDVALPIVRPMIGAFTLLSFMSAWNSFLWPQVVLQSPEKYTLPIGLANMAGTPEYQSHFGVLMAATVLSIAPVAVLFFVLQRDFVSGLASGAVKG